MKWRTPADIVEITERNGHAVLVEEERERFKRQLAELFTKEKEEQRCKDLSMKG